MTSREFSDDALLGLETEPIPRGSHGRIDLVFLDRDGTLNVHRPGYVDRPEDLVMLPGAVDGVRALNDAGVPVVLVTNQQGLGTGRLTRPQLVAVHRRLLEHLADGGAHLDAIHVCPHRKDTCDCRKPRPGMLLAALARAPWARANRCVLVGDQRSDIAAAEAAGVPARWVAAGGLGDTIHEFLLDM